VITVGAYADRDTVSTFDDEMYVCSGFKDPRSIAAATARTAGPGGD
jgi:hypothetical protein